MMHRTLVSTASRSQLHRGGLGMGFIVLLSALLFAIVAPLAGAVRPTIDEQAPPVLDNVLNEDCTVTILNQTVRVDANGSWTLPNVPSANVITRVKVLCEREDGTILAGQSEFIELVPGETIPLGFVTLGPVPPTVESIEVSTADVPAKGTALPDVQITVTGTLSDGTIDVDLTPASAGTVYTSSNPRIVSVDENGLAMRISSGTAIISIVNEGIFATTVIQNFFGDDRDFDGMPDGYEIMIGLNPDNADDAGISSDEDTLTNLDEFQRGTDPFLADTDGDGLNDDEEVALGTNPLLADTDGDGLIDGEEAALAVPSNPLLRDTDGDGLPDGVELDLTMGADTVSANAFDDTDMDGLPNLNEVQEGTDPLNPDSDGDGIDDGDEVLNGTDPLVADMEPPVVALLVPQPGAELVEGETVGVTAEVTDFGPIIEVDVLVNGMSLATFTPSPPGPPPLFGENFVVDFTVPAASEGSIDMEVTATDGNDNTGTSGVQTFTVIPDPLTAVTGRVVDEEGIPIAGADVTLYPGNETAMQTTTSAADGTFMFAGAPTVFGNVFVSAFATVDDVDLRGAASAPPVREGNTNLGDITILEAFFEEELGTRLNQSDDDFDQFFFTDGFSFTYYGVTYDNVFVGSNGYLTFNVGDTIFRPIVPDGVVFGVPRISIMFTDILPTLRTTDPNGDVYVNQFPDRLVVTWYRIGFFSISGSELTIQMILFADGRIQYAYNGITEESNRDNLSVAVSPGTVNGINPTVRTVDFTTDLPLSSTADEGLIENFANSTLFDLDGMFMLFVPNGEGGFDINLVPNPDPMEPNEPLPDASISVEDQQKAIDDAIRNKQ